jgi:signal transduction histidine kinase
MDSAAMTADHPPFKLQDCQLLVVDDEEDVLKAIRRQLRKKFKVHTAQGAEEAYSILRENHINVVISDQRMPGISGAEFLTQVRQEFPNAVRLMLTGYADINAVIAAINDGRIEQYIQKPWDAGELERIISESYELQVLRSVNERLSSELALALKAEKRFNQLQSDFITLVSHEFRTPLAIILMSAEMLRTYYLRLETDKIEEKLTQIVDQVQQMENLLQEVMAVGAYERGLRKFQPLSLDICALLRTCIDSVKASLAGKQTFVTDIPQDCPHFVGDEHLITDIITELIANAIKFSPDEGTITCRLRVDSTQADISIADEGQGMSEQDMDRIFKPFVKGENADTIHGIGLGLAIVRHAVKLHRGQISVEPNAGGGTVIRVILPSL